MSNPTFADECRELRPDPRVERMPFVDLDVVDVHAARPFVDAEDASRKVAEVADGDGEAACDRSARAPSRIVFSGPPPVPRTLRSSRIESRPAGHAVAPRVGGRSRRAPSARTRGRVRRPPRRRRPAENHATRAGPSIMRRPKPHEHEHGQTGQRATATQPAGAGHQTEDDQRGSAARLKTGIAALTSVLPDRGGRRLTRTLSRPRHSSPKKTCRSVRGSP